MHEHEDQVGQVRVLVGYPDTWKLEGLDLVGGTVGDSGVGGESVECGRKNQGYCEHLAAVGVGSVGI